MRWTEMLSICQEGNIPTLPIRQCRKRPLGFLGLAPMFFSGAHCFSALQVFRASATAGSTVPPQTVSKSHLAPGTTPCGLSSSCCDLRREVDTRMQALPETRAAGCHRCTHPEPDLQLPDQGWTRAGPQTRQFCCCMRVSRWHQSTSPWAPGVRGSTSSSPWSISSCVEL